MREIKFRAFWNDKEVEIKGLTYEVVADKKRPLVWYNKFNGQRRQGLEITTQNNEKFIIDNEYGDGYYKATVGRGCPPYPHKGVFDAINIEYIEDKKINKKLKIHAIREEDEEVEEYQKKNFPKKYKKVEALKKLINKR